MKSIKVGILLFVLGFQAFTFDLSSIIPLISSIETAEVDRYWIAHPEVLPGVGVSVINRGNGKRVTAMAVRASRTDPLGRVLISRGLAAALDVRDGQESRLGIEALTRGGNPGLPSEIPFQDPDVDMSLLAGRYVIPPAGRTQAATPVPAQGYQTGLFSSSTKITSESGQMTSTSLLASKTVSSGSFYVVETGPVISGGIEYKKTESTQASSLVPPLSVLPEPPVFKVESAAPVFPPPALPITRSPSGSGVEGGDLLFLQIGIFSVQTGMKQMVEHFMQYFPVEIRTVKLDGKIYYKLFLGPLYGSARTNARKRAMDYGVRDAFFSE